MKSCKTGGNLRQASGNVLEQKNMQITTLLFLSAKEIPDNDLLNKDLKVLLLPPNLMIKT